MNSCVSVHGYSPQIWGLRVFPFGGPTRIRRVLCSLTVNLISIATTYLQLFKTFYKLTKYLLSPRRSWQLGCNTKVDSAMIDITAQGTTTFMT